MATSHRWGIAFGVGLLGVLGCGGEPEVSTGPGGLTGGSSGAGAEGGSSGNAGSGGSGGTGVMVTGGASGTGSGADGGTGGKPTDPCKSIECDEGQRCESAGGEGECVDNSCDDLECDADTELCESVKGGGHICIDKCRNDAGCAENQFCDTDTGACVDDSCTPDTTTCDAGDKVRVCSSNGSPGEPIACGSAGYYESTCSEDQVGAGACTCEDDWDCPNFMTCDAGVCSGTGVAPTCTLPPTPFSEVLPEEEFRWGGEKHEYDDTNADDANDDASGKAFPWSAQVVSVPLVVNLDDDNGDGIADERDFPEILFITHYDTQRDSNGIVRAIHGGGPNKGGDYFALCGNPARPATPAASYSDAAGAFWSEGDPVLTDCATGGDAESRTTALVRSSSALAAGDLDADGFPEIVVLLEDKSFQILSHRGEVLFKSPVDLTEVAGADQYYVAPTPQLANLDFAGMPEIIIGNRVVSLKKDDMGAFAIDKVYIAASGSRGVQGRLVRNDPGDDLFITGPTVCVADLSADPGMEIAAGPMVYRLPASPPDGCGDPTNLAVACPLDVVWDARPSLGAEQAEGFCAVADVLGACADPADCTANPPGPDHPLDGKPEVVLIADGHLVILDGATGALLRDDALGGGDWGGAPNVDDFDGDGFPEIATALSDLYTVIDLQAPDVDNCPVWDQKLDDRSDPPQGNDPRNPGNKSCTKDSDCTLSGTTCNELAKRCVCLHNGWMRDTEDDSSRVTSSSVFDFNGDGAAEVAYGDECYFRVYDGATGGVYLALPSVSRTIIENPVVADVDNDGNAEIVFINNNWVEQCGEGNMGSNGWDPGETLTGPQGPVDKDQLPNGITVLGDPTDTWVAARRIWNQHAYHVTNVLESGAIPEHEPESWKPLNGRLYNTYRSQPRNYGVAPDLALTAIQISSPGAACGELSDTLQITVVVKNQGDLRVGPGVEVAFYGTWDGDETALDDDAGDPIVITLDKSLEPGASTLVTVEYEVGNNPDPYHDAPPDSVRVSIDGGNDSKDGKERECVEDNNEIDQDVDAGQELADLSIEIDSAKCSGEVKVTVTNEGSDAASDVVVRVYAGDPSSGGKVLAEETIDELDAGASETITLQGGAQARNVTVWAVVDPDDTVEECNDANNLVEGPMLMCRDEPR
ncbi:MAG TPA: CARDB domain-containing protein [Polyangiaceae bacterium]|nr:CARDB domain-containing protein [Polyangiaceae bacterium]